MKTPLTFYYILLSLFILTFTQCSEESGISFNDPSVKVFVQQIKSDRYVAKGPSGNIEVPNFKRHQIPTLLIYAKDNTPVKEYPVNPITTIKLDTYRLSQCLLWTIEKIRVDNYPSLTPALLEKDHETGEYIMTDSDGIMEVWELYNQWWTEIEESSSSEEAALMYKQNPLAGSNYIWY